MFDKLPPRHPNEHAPPACSVAANRQSLASIGSEVPTGPPAERPKSIRQTSSSKAARCEKTAGNDRRLPRGESKSESPAHGRVFATRSFLCGERRVAAASWLRPAPPPHSREWVGSKAQARPARH